MQSIKNSILQHLRFSVSSRQLLLIQRENVLEKLGKLICTSSGATQDQILDKVIALVKRYDNINASKVTETADFKKDLSLDSLDRVELIMALEEEFSVEIPDEKADKLTCCVDIAKYIASETKPNNSDS